MNIEPYDSTIDPAVWIEDFLLHIHMARGDDLHTIKYLPLKRKGQLGTGRISYQKTLLGAGKTWRTLSEINSKVPMFAPRHRRP